MERCTWATNELNIAYHDTEWGVPVHDDRTLFEFLVLEGAQAGLSWDTILRKREAYREAFDNFDPAKVAKYADAQCARLLLNEGIIRNRLKIASAIKNAQLFLDIQKEFGSFDKYIWQFVGGKPIQNNWKSKSDVPPESEESKSLSKDLKKRGFKFAGSTIMYAHMQACGLVNDHLVACFRYKEVTRK